jgi:hypothetical protein
VSRGGLKNDLPFMKKWIFSKKHQERFARSGEFTNPSFRVCGSHGGRAERTGPMCGQSCSKTSPDDFDPVMGFYH